MEEKIRRYVGIDLAKRAMEIRIIQDDTKTIGWNQKTDSQGIGCLTKTIGANVGWMYYA